MHVTIFLEALPMACLVHFANLCFNEGYIFHGWYRFIYWKLYLQKKEPLTRQTVFPEFAPPGPSRWKQSLFRVLGGCIDCFGVWLTIPFYMVLFEHNLVMLVSWPLFVGSSYIWYYLLQTAFDLGRSHQQTNENNNQSGLQPSEGCRKCGEQATYKLESAEQQHVATVYRAGVDEPHHYSGA